MKKIILDEVTKGQAKEYANNDAEINGYAFGSPKWQEAYKEFISHALSAMTVGRNPRGTRYKVYTTLYPEAFGANGFAGKCSENYKKVTGKEMPLIAAEGRILSTVMNLVKMFEAGIMETKNTTNTDKQGKISNAEMSELQFPTKDDTKTEDEYQAEVKDVLENWLVRDIISNCVMEGLTPLFTLTKNDVQKIMAQIKIEADVNKIQEVIKKAREELIRELRKNVMKSQGEMRYIDWVL